MTLGLAAVHAGPVDAPEPGEFHRSPRAIDTFQRCLGGPGLPSAKADAGIKDALLQSRNAVGLDLFALAPDKYAEWLNRVDSPVMKNYGVAAHETSHFVNSIVRACRPEVTGYYFFGNVFFIDTRPFETPNYSKVDELLPGQFGGLRQSFRYRQYILKSRQHKGNDLRILLDEWLSYIAGATVEWVAYAAQPVAAAPQANPVLVDADVIGAQEFAVFTALYLADFKASSPAAYQRVICAADGAVLLKQAWERLQQVQKAQQQLDARQTSPRARQTPPEVTAFLAADETQRFFKNPCSAAE